MNVLHQSSHTHALHQLVGKSKVLHQSSQCSHSCSPPIGGQVERFTPIISVFSLMLSTNWWTSRTFYTNHLSVLTHALHQLVGKSTLLHQSFHTPALHQLVDKSTLLHQSSHTHAIHQLVDKLNVLHQSSPILVSTDWKGKWEALYKSSYTSTAESALVLLDFTAAQSFLSWQRMPSSPPVPGCRNCHPVDLGTRTRDGEVAASAV